MATNPAYVDELIHQLSQLARADHKAYLLVLANVTVEAPLSADLPVGVRNATSIDLLEELKRRGGHPGALAEAALLCIRKSQDYNQGMGQDDPHTVDRSAYFPFGAVSYAQMLHTKSQRFNSLTKKIMDGGDANFEGLRDTALDIINYAGFFAGQHKE